jgi:hypothetical protein
MKQLKVSLGVVKNTNGQVLISLRDKLADQITTENHIQYVIRVK